MQFLIEAVLVSLGGGIAGAVIGGLLATYMGGVSFGGRALEGHLTPEPVILALAVSVAIGLVFGIYPPNAPRGCGRSRRCGTSRAARSLSIRPWQLFARGLAFGQVRQPAQLRRDRPRQLVAAQVRAWSARTGCPIPQE